MQKNNFKMGAKMKKRNCIKRGNKLMKLMIKRWKSQKKKMKKKTLQKQAKAKKNPCIENWGDD